MLLQQVAQSDVKYRDEVLVSWSDVSSDMPEDWKAVVKRCLSIDPKFRTRELGYRNL
jgi:hypothetical protein